MGFKDYLTRIYLMEEPQIVGDENWDLDKIAVNDNYRKKLMKSGSDHLETLGDYNGLQLYRYKKEIFALDPDAPRKLAYWVKISVDTDSNLGARILTQRALWRDRNNSQIEGLAAHIFFSYWLPNYEAVATDSLQTDAGRAFWLNRISQSFKKKLFVYFYDTSSEKPMLEHLLDNKEFEKLKNSGKIWGTGKDYQKQRILISRNPISPNSNVDFVN